MPLDTYTNLKATIADTLARDDLTSQIDDFINLVEARHKREIRFRSMLHRAQSTVDGRYLGLPAVFLEMQTLRLLTDPVTVLAEVNLQEMNRLRQTATGIPAHFTIHEEIEFDRAPDSSYSAEMIYYAELTPLSASNETNG